MADVDPTLSDMQRAVTNAFGAHWKLFLFQGVVMVILGVLAICAPVAASIAVAIYVGWLLLISGVIGLIADRLNPPRPRLSLEPDYCGALGGDRRTAGADARSGCDIAHRRAHRVLHRRGRVSDLGRDRLPSRAGRDMGLDAVERSRRPGIGSDHHRGLAGNCDLGAWTTGGSQPAHVGLGGGGGGPWRTPDGRSHRSHAGVAAPQSPVASSIVGRLHDDSFMRIATWARRAPAAIIFHPPLVKRLPNCPRADTKAYA